MSRMQVLLSLLICTTIASAIDVNLVIEKQQQIVRTMLKTQNLRSTFEMRLLANVSSEMSFDETPVEPNAALMEACFNHSQLQQAATLATYQSQLELCDKRAADARAEMWKHSNETREALMRRIDDACENRKRCENLSDGRKFFVCFSEMITAASLNLNNVSVIATGHVGAERTSHQQIELARKSCSADVESAFINTYARINKEMEACVLGKFTPPGYQSDDSSSESPDELDDSLELTTAPNSPRVTSSSQD